MSGNTAPYSPPPKAGPSSPSASVSSAAHRDLLRQPFIQRHGRRHLRVGTYPLPIDLPELQRQNLRTTLLCRVFGRTVCSPSAQRSVPRHVLEVGCGTGYWSALCHEEFAKRGHRDVSFTGIDVAAVSCDARSQPGMRWRFVQHDLRRLPWPFADEEFDLVMLKDLGLAFPFGAPGASQRVLEQSLRVLCDGGTLEVWESDHVLRALQPDPPPPLKTDSDEADIARRTATYIVSPGTPFAPIAHPQLRDANAWIAKTLLRLRLPSTPCVEIAPAMFQEPESLGEVGSRRIAIPLGGELRWEQARQRRRPSMSATRDSLVLEDLKLGDDAETTVAAATAAKGLTPEQASLRYVALLTYMQMLESLEPLLREVSGLDAEEWVRWWNGLMAGLLDPGAAAPAARPGVLTGECLEIGAWWATKLER